MPEDSVFPLAQSISKWAERMDVSPRYVHMLARLADDPLPTLKLGKRRVVPVVAGEAWFNARLNRAA